MIAQITVVDWEKSRLGDRCEPIVFSFRKEDIDLGAEDETLESLVSQFQAAQDLKDGCLTCNARVAYRCLARKAVIARNPALEMLCAHQLALTLDSPEEIVKALEELDERIDAEYNTLHESSGRAMRFTCSLENMQAILRCNISHYKAMVHGRLCQARLDVIDDILAEQCFERAEYYARSTASTIAEQLGKNHWWRGILLLRQARCLGRLNKLDEAEEVLSIARAILVEWCCEEEHPLAGELGELNSLSRQLSHPDALKNRAARTEQNSRGV